MSEFDEYIVHGEPGQKEKADAWQTVIGPQDVDGLKVSPYLLDSPMLDCQNNPFVSQEELYDAQYPTIISLSNNN